MALIREWSENINVMKAERAREMLQAIEALESWDLFASEYRDMSQLKPMLMLKGLTRKPRAKTTKTRRIEGVATIVRTGSGYQGCMAWETPYIVIAIHGERYIYQSDRIGLKGMEVEKGDIVRVDMRVGVDTDRVWRMYTLEKTGI